MKNITKFAVSFVAVAALFVAANAQAYTHMGTLKMGSTGSQVMELQKALNGNGFSVSVSGAGSSGMESTYFGAKTKAAVMNFQAAKGLVADGIVGPASGAALSGLTGTGSGGTSTVPGCSTGAMFSSTTGAPCTGGTSTPTGPLAGTDGSISSFTELSSYANEEVGEGQEDVKVAGFEIEATNDGDIAIKSIKVVNTITNGSGSKDLDDYVDSMDIWMGSTKVGSADADDFNEDSSGVWSKSVTLSNAVVRADDTEKFYITVNAANSFDSGDIDSETFVVDVTNIRFTDGSGVTTTDTTTSGIGSLDVTAAFVSFSSSADTELKISASSDSPESTIVKVDSSDNTDEVSMLKGEIEVEGESDVWLDELPFTVTATGDSPAATTGTVTLEIDGETFTKSVTTTSASSATITFDDLDLDIEAGATIDFEVTADINDIEDTGAAATDFDEGDQLTVSLTTTNRASIVAENEQGDSLTDSTEMTGSATGNAMTFRTEGVNAEIKSVSYSKTEDTNGLITSSTFTIQVDVTAFGDTLYIGQSGQFASTATASNAFAVVFEHSGTPTTADVTSSASIAVSSDATIVSNGFRLNDGETETFTLEVTQVTPGLLGAITAGNYRVRLDEIRVFTGSGLESAATATNVDMVPTSDFRTGFKYINS